MKKIFFTIIFIISSVASQSQSVLETNRSPFATELVTFIENDTLKMKSQFKISRVDVFSKSINFDLEIYSSEKNMEIPLKDLPNSRYLICVFTNRKIIVLAMNVKQLKNL